MAARLTTAAHRQMQDELQRMMEARRSVLLDEAIVKQTSSFNHVHIYAIQHMITDLAHPEENWAVCNCGDKHRVFSEAEMQELQDKIGIQKNMVKRLNEEVVRLTAIIQELEGLENDPS